MSIPYDEKLAEFNNFPVKDKWMSYEKFVCNLVKDRGSIQANLDHMIIGIGGESGEIMDCIKKYTCYNKELDRTNLVEELGDIEFYLAGLRQMTGITRHETLIANIHKNGLRYKDGYSDAAAQARADKTEEGK